MIKSHRLSIAQHKLSKDGPCRSKQRADIEPPAVRYRWWWWSVENWNEAGCQSADFSIQSYYLSFNLFFFVIIINVAVFIAKKANNIPVLALSSSTSLPDVVKIFKVFFTSSSSLTICRHHRASPKTGIFKSSYFTFHFKCTSLARDAIYMLILPFPSSLSLRLLPTSVYAHGVCLSSLVMMEIGLISRILLSANRKLMWLIFRLFFSLCMYIKRTHTWNYFSNLEFFWYILIKFYPICNNLHLFPGNKLWKKKSISNK